MPAGQAQYAMADKESMLSPAPKQEYVSTPQEKYESVDRESYKMQTGSRIQVKGDTKNYEVGK